MEQKNTYCFKTVFNNKSRFFPDYSNLLEFLTVSQAILCSVCNILSGVDDLGRKNGLEVIKHVTTDVNQIRESNISKT